jgi:5'-3' exonuclease
MKSFKEINDTPGNSLMILDSLNLGFRYLHAGTENFCEDYMRTVLSLKKSYKCDKLIIAGDMGSSSYRKALDPEYKANRKKKYEDQTAEEEAKFEEFFAEMQRILQKYEADGVYPVVRFPGVEADDISAYIVGKRKKNNIDHIWLISSDRDWNLLVDKNVSQFSYVTRKEFTYDNWHEHYDWTKDEYISIKVLQGDPGDNIKGVPGIGPKRALELVRAYGSVYDIMANMPLPGKYKYIDALNKFGADNLQLNYKLMDLVTYCEEAIGEENCKRLDQQLKDYL